MKLHRVFFLLIAMVIIAFFMGCAEDGEQGLQGPPGAPGTGGPETYLGGNGDACAHCHDQTIKSWAETNHSNAYTDLTEENRTNLYCVHCHTTGFDATVASGDTEIAPGNEGPDIYGFDDYVGIDTPEATARRADLENVQCEACHGPMGPID